MGESWLWWQKGVIYQVYPRSFRDANGDGVGDLQGVIERVDYLEWLGVDAVWLSPIYPSPMADFGYDVSDYCAVHPLFGTLDDLDRLIEALHRRGMKLILDLVPNHSSDQHPWFLESRSSRDDPKRDWYLWRDPAPDGGPPNNWLSVFGGSAWEWDAHTGQYYYHAFLKEQPDLNWRNPEVEAAMLDVMRFWFDRGVDGFRVDVMWHLIKDHRLRDNPENPDWRPDQNSYSRLLPIWSTDRPAVHDIVARMRAVADEYDERLIIGEIYLPIRQLVVYYGDGQGAHLPFNFQLITLPWKARTIDVVVNEYEAVLPEDSWPNWVLGNHDTSRIATRVGRAQARVAAMMLLTLRGTPTMYYGDELGMRDGVIPPERVHDPQELNEPGLGRGRDPERTPMQWTAEPKAGFTRGDPWLPVNPEHVQNNVETQRDNPAALLTLYRRLLELRRREPALSVGEHEHVTTTGDLLAYRRRYGDRCFLIALNLSHRPAGLRPRRFEVRGQVVLSTLQGRELRPIDGDVELDGDEGVIVLLDERRAVPRSTP